VTRAPLPPNEVARLAALDSYEILDSPPEPSFDTLVRLTAQIFQVPTALVSLVDRERQWFKARVGIDVCETDRTVAFCAHAILTRAPLIVEDALEDPRFADNPLVVGPPHVRFYAGAPLISSDGFQLGTLCILDSAPRRFDESETEQLCDVARLVVDQLELRKRGLLLAEQTDQLRTQTRRLSRANRELDEFVQSAAHDLRAPLRHIIGFSQLLEKSLATTLGERERGFLSRIVESTGRMDQLLQALYEFAQTAGEIELERVSASEAVRDVLEDLSLAIEGVGAEIHVGKLPDVCANGAHLRRVIQNLLDNAIKYRSKTREPVKIDILATPLGKAWKFEVRDNGVGFSDAIQEQIFCPFRRACLEQEVEGLGMGLALCKRVIERMNGRIWAESKPDEGSSFYFTLPDANADKGDSGVEDALALASEREELIDADR